MIWANTDDRYGAVHKTLHWVIALLVLVMLVMGLVMDNIPNGPDKFWVFGIHKSIGITVLFLMLTRLGWKLANWHKPKPLATHQTWERRLAESVHWGFYALLIAMPLSGWLGTGAANSTINWFGFFVVPNLNAPNPDLREAFFEAHEVIANLLWVAVGLHVAGAIKHAVIDKDNTLRRMMPFGAFMLMLLPAMALAADKPVTTWTIDRDHSRLGITATQEGAPFEAAFTAFDGTIALDPAAPQTGSANITIDLNSFASGNTERDSTVKNKDWFDVESTPTATYKIASFEKGADDGTYVARGTLVLRGLERPLDLPFKLDISEKDGTRTAHAVGKTTLSRLAYEVGGGDWKDPSMVGDNVDVTIDLIATTKSK